jgi:phosphatidylglycerol:prolipoprotein diacylglycerol transferase
MCPILFHLGTFQLSSYSVFAELGALLAFGFLYAKTGRMGLRVKDDFWFLVNSILIGGFAGGRIGFLVTDPPPLAFPWKGYVFGLTSGFSVFGVFAGMAVGVLLFCRVLGYPYRRILDFLCTVLPFWIATARVGCFLTGCCYGRPVPSPWPWAVTFTDPRSALPRALLGVPLHPVQLYEALGDLLLGLLLLRVLARAERGRSSFGGACAGFLGGYGLLRLVMEAFRGDTQHGVGCISLGQVHALGFILVAGACWAQRRRQPRAQGREPLKELTRS